MQRQSQKLIAIILSLSFIFNIILPVLAQSEDLDFISDPRTIMEPESNQNPAIVAPNMELPDGLVIDLKSGAIVMPSAMDETPPPIENEVVDIY